MLTAFNYYEPEEENRIRKGIKDTPFFRRELEIAKEFSLDHPNPLRRKQCCVCGGKKLQQFYEKWGIRYLRCGDCYSIMADVQESDLQAYTEIPALVELRNSEAYQNENSEIRQSRWEEQIDWLKFRTFRYFGKNQDFSVIDYGSRWDGWIAALHSCGFCGKYELRRSVRKRDTDKVEQADVVLALDYVQQEMHPVEFFKEVHDSLKPDALFVISTKVGSGFDILTLRENNRNVFPYEHVMLPSKVGIEILLSQTGFELLEITTPGTFDINFVKNSKEGLAENDYFMRYFLETATPSAEADFQRFIQKAGLSSYAQVIAKRMK